MKLKGGIQVHEDDQVNQYQKADLSDANRQKTNTQKQIDALLFGPKPIRRRNLNKSATQTPSKPTQEKKQEAQIKPSPLPPKTPSRNPHQTPTQNRGHLSRNTQRTDRSRLSRTSQKTEENLLDSASKNSDFNSGSKQRPIPPRSKPKPKEPTPPTPKPVIEPVEQKQTRGIFNRPSYIRKLKKIAQNYQYHHLNQKNHRYFDIIRQVDCYRETVLKHESAEFIDQYFPHTGLSISYKDQKQNFQWKKSNNVYKKIGFGRYIDPNDIQPGKYSSPNFLSVLACLSQKQQNIKRLIENQSYKLNGFHYVRLYINSSWKYFSVDDYLPEIDGEAVGARSFADNEVDLWASLIEKAYAKAYGAYEIFNRQVSAKQYLKDLTGTTIKQYSCQEEQIKQKIEEACKCKYTVIAIPKDNIEQIGLDKNYNIYVKGLNSKKNIQMRNSWGTIYEKPSINLSKDGIFQLNVGDFQKYFDLILIAQTANQLCTTTIQSKHQKSFYSCYTFDVPKTGIWKIDVCQWDKKLFPSAMKYQYSPFHVIIERRQKNGDRKLIKGGYSTNSRNLEVQSNLQQGNYGIYCIGSWNQKAFNYHLTIHGHQNVDIKRIHINGQPNQITKCLSVLNIENDNKKTKNNITEYTHIEKESNLVVVTVINKSEKNQNCSQDFSRIKNQFVKLITKPSQQEDLTRLQNMKKKSVSFSLKSNQQYSWVFSVSNKNPQNIRQLGFS